MKNTAESAVLAQFDKTGHEVVQVRHLRLGGESGVVDVVDVRGWYPEYGGEWRPGGGLVIRADQLPQLIKALEQAGGALEGGVGLV